jgi:hypothetical protein
MSQKQLDFLKHHLTIDPALAGSIGCLEEFPHFFDPTPSIWTATNLSPHSMNSPCHTIP